MLAAYVIANGDRTAAAAARSYKAATFGGGGGFGSPQPAGALGVALTPQVLKETTEQIAALTAQAREAKQQQQFEQAVTDQPGDGVPGCLECQKPVWEVVMLEPS